MYHQSGERPRRTGGARSNQQGHADRQRLLDATAEVISRRGFSGTRLSDIGEAAKIRAPAIYCHNSSSDELIEEVMKLGAAAMLEHLKAALEALPAGAGPVERIAAAVDAHLRMELDPSDYSRAIIRNANQLPTSVGGRALKLVGAYNAVWRTLLADLGSAGLLRPDLQRGIARMLVLGALNWAAEWFEPEAGPVDTVIETAQSMVLHALIADCDIQGPV